MGAVRGYHELQYAVLPSEFPKTGRRFSNGVVSAVMRKRRARSLTVLFMRSVDDCQAPWRKGVHSALKKRAFSERSGGRRR